MCLFFLRAFTFISISTSLIRIKGGIFYKCHYWQNLAISLSMITIVWFSLSLVFFLYLNTLKSTKYKVYYSGMFISGYRIEPMMFKYLHTEHVFFFSFRNHIVSYILVTLFTIRIFMNANNSNDTFLKLFSIFSRLLNPIIFLHFLCWNRK